MSATNTSSNNNKTTTTALTYEVLRKEDDVASCAVIQHLGQFKPFQQLSHCEGQDIKTRDDADDVKLAAGIQISVKKGVIPANPNVSESKKINVSGKSAEEVAGEILSTLPSKEGNILILQGLSGTGKGTTVKKLQELLPRCVTWSNGNLFRSITHLLSEDCGAAWSESSITTAAVAAVMKRLSFEQVEGKEYDVIIDGKTRVKDIQNTLLKRREVSARVPAVAEQTQGEVICFAASAVETLKKAGYNVILEGRAQTLNYIPSPHRYELVMPHLELLGQRRAAQVVMAEALKRLKDGATEEDVRKALEDVSTEKAKAL